MENEEILINDTEPTVEPTPEPFVIPYVYNYSAETKEYIGQQRADKDPAESLAKGKFIPLVPANATLLEPPTVEENQIQIYSKTIETHQEPYEVIDPETGESHTEYKTVTTVIENWNIEADYRKNFVKVDNNLNVSEIDTIGEQTGYIVVDNAIGEDIKANKDWYKIVDGEIVKKSQEEYEQEQAEKRQELFLQDFFKVNGYGYYRKVPKGYQSAIESVNTAYNMCKENKGLPAGVFIFYEEPDFTKPEECTEEWLIQHQITLPAMSETDFIKLFNLFITTWNRQEHQ